jgi:uncharacterized membrane protein YbhN (UPF0104 family)
VLQAFRRSPAALGTALTLSLLVQGITVVAFIIISQSVRIGNMTILDISVAAPLAMVANVLPITPGGLGVGEAAFDQLCRWLDPAPGAAAYASIFFAYRAVSAVTLIPGLLAFIVYRSDLALNRAKRASTS